MRALSASVLAALLVLGTAEAAVRVAEPALAEPQRWSTQEAQYKVEQMRELPPDGVVFAGSSMMGMAGDASRMPHAYNAALRGASLAMTEEWLELAVVPTLRPHTVVLGVSTRELNANDGAQATSTKLFLDAPAVRRLTGRETVLDRAERWGEQVSALFRYRTVLRRPGDLFAKRDTVEGATIGADGHDDSFRRRSYELDDAGRAFFAREPLHDFAVGTAQLQSLRRTVQWLRDRRIDVVVAAMPVTADYAALHPGGTPTYEAAIGRLHDTAVRAGARWVDFGIWPTRLFADPMHVNGAGAARFTDRIAELLSPEAT